MSEGTARNVVLGTILVTGAVVGWDNIKKTGKASPSGKSLVAFTVLAAALAVGAGVAPGVVGPFALLIGLSIVVSRVG